MCDVSRGEMALHCKVKFFYAAWEIKIPVRRNAQRSGPGQRLIRAGHDNLLWDYRI
jgi:hypothetical protein